MPKGHQSASTSDSAELHRQGWCPENVGITDRIPSNCVKYYPCSVANSRCMKPVRSASSKGRVWTNLGSLAQEGLIDKPCDINSGEPCVERLRCRLNQEVVDNNGQVIFDIQEVRCRPALAQTADSPMPPRRPTPLLLHHR